MNLGSTDPRVPTLRERLAVEDPLMSTASPAMFDEGLRFATVRTQQRYGLGPDTVVGPDFLGHLNRPVAQRIAQIIANMERWRWLAPIMPTTRV